MCRGRRFGGGASDYYSSSSSSSAPCSRLLLLLLLRAAVGSVEGAAMGEKNFLRADAREYSLKFFFALTRECMGQKFSSR